MNCHHHIYYYARQARHLSRELTSFLPDKRLCVFYRFFSQSRVYILVKCLLCNTHRDNEMWETIIIIYEYKKTLLNKRAIENSIEWCYHNHHRHQWCLYESIKHYTKKNCSSSSSSIWSSKYNAYIC